MHERLKLTLVFGSVIYSMEPIISIPVYKL